MQSVSANRQPILPSAATPTVVTLLPSSPRTRAHTPSRTTSCCRAVFVHDAAAVVDMSIFDIVLLLHHFKVSSVPGLLCGLIRVHLPHTRTHKHTHTRALTQTHTHTRVTRTC
uniref:(northern house mosquito) hypothetical protein n=1 Tax=Culex pipiens TaxID=7175 RepID=A0A8D8E8T6_CULPI